MKALTIKFKEKPEGLEEVMANVPAFQKAKGSNLIWEWDSGCGRILILGDKDSPLIGIYANNSSGMIQKRIHAFVNRMQEHYKGCEIIYNKEFY